MIKFIMNFFCGENFKDTKKYWDHRDSERKKSFYDPSRRSIPNGGIPYCVIYGNPKRYGYNGSWRKYV